MYKQFWTVTAEDGTEVNLIFTTKKDAAAWIAAQPNAAAFAVVKHSM